MLRVCFLTHYFPPEVGAPQTRIALLTRRLAEGGAAVTVHTGFPHYPSGTIPAPYRNRFWQVEQRDGVRVIRSAVYPAANRGFTRRLMDHSAFAASALATAPLSGPLDVVVAETPPLFTAAAGAAYAALKRAALVIHVADRWPASAVELGALSNRRAIAAATALEHWSYRRADAILAPTQGIVDALSALPSAAGRSHRVWPVVDVERFRCAAPDAGREGAPLRVLYAGTVGMAHGLGTLVEASRLAGPQVVDTTIAGAGADVARLAALVRERSVSNVTLLGSVEPEEIPRLYAAADAGTVLLRDVPIFAGALPTKLFEVMASGRPVVLCARGEPAAVVQESGGGIVVVPEDPAALAQAFRDLQADPALRRALGVAGRAWVERRLGADRAVEEWSSLLSGARGVG